MKTLVPVFLAAASLLWTMGCTTTTEIYDPGTVDAGLRSSGTVSSAEMLAVARAAATDALASPKFNGYLAQFRAANGNRNPVMKLAPAVNETNDPDLNTAEITDAVSEVLLNSGKVEVSLAEGSNRTGAIAASRDVAHDANFNASTVAKAGRLIAANLVLRPKVVSNEVRDGRTRATVRTFVMDMADIDTGLVMWKFSRQLGFTKTKRVLGL